MIMATPPVSISPFEYGTSPAFSALSERLDLMSWLQLVQAHSRSGSSDDQKVLKKLALNLPDYRDASPEMQDVFERITQVVSRDKHDKDLSPASHKALMALMQRFSSQMPRTKSIARRVLFTSGDESP